ncbi:MAG: calcium-binding protein [Sphingomonadaceae bacterium]
MAGANVRLVNPWLTQLGIPQDLTYLTRQNSDVNVLRAGASYTDGKTVVAGLFDNLVQTNPVNGATVDTGNFDFSAFKGAIVAIGSGADNSYTGTAFADWLYGNGGVDTLKGGGGNDHIWGDDRFDPIVSGDDVIEGGAGNDRIDAGPGNDEVDGGTYNDTISGGDGNDTLKGGTGNDVISGDGGDDYLIGGTKDDTLYSGAGPRNTLEGGDGNDTIIFASGGGYVEGDKGNDTIDIRQKTDPVSIRYLSSIGADVIVNDLSFDSTSMNATNFGAYFDMARSNMLSQIDFANIPLARGSLIWQINTVIPIMDDPGQPFWIYGGVMIIQIIGSSASLESVSLGTIIGGSTYYDILSGTESRNDYL